MPGHVTRRSTLATLAGASPLLAAGSAPLAHVVSENAIGVATDYSPVYQAKGAGAHLRTLSDKLGELSVSIVDYGAVGDGNPANAAINTAAIRAAMLHAASLLPPASGFARTAEIFVPPGIFVVEPRVFNPPKPTLGLRFRGVGWFSSLIRLVPSSGDERWMFDNAGGEELLAFPMFSDLCFEGCDLSRGSGPVPAGAGLMRIEAHNTAQGFRFERCLFQGFDTCFRFAGSNLASENKYFDCKFFDCNTVAIFANPQSFNTDFIGTEIEEIHSSVFHFLPSNAGPGGGAVRVSNSSLLPTGDCAIVRLDASMLTQGVVIRDSRIEMRGRSRFFQGHTDLAYGELTIVDCGILNTETRGVRCMAEVGPSQTLRFVRCMFGTLGQDERYAFIPQRNRYMAGPRLLWEDCQLPFDMAARIDNRGEHNHAGQASARNCRTNEGQANAEGVIHAADFDLYGQGDSMLVGPAQATQGADAQLRRKTIALKLGTSNWPYINSYGEVEAETQVVLPPHARILRIVIVKEAQGCSAALYALRVRTAAGSVLLDTPPAAQKATLVARYDPEAENRVPHACGEALPTRTVVLTCRPGTAAAATDHAQQGYAYMEYL